MITRLVPLIQPWLMHLFSIVDLLLLPKTRGIYLLVSELILTPEYLLAHVWITIHSCIPPCSYLNNFLLMPEYIYVRLNILGLLKI